MKNQTLILNMNTNPDTGSKNNVYDIMAGIEIKVAAVGYV